jgi:hypothetical protein
MDCISEMTAIYMMLVGVVFGIFIAGVFGFVIGGVI